MTVEHLTVDQETLLAKLHGSIPISIPAPSAHLTVQCSDSSRSALRSSPSHLTHTPDTNDQPTKKGKS